MILVGGHAEPQVGPESGKMMPVSEVKRRDAFLQDIGKEQGSTRER